MLIIRNAAGRKVPLCGQNENQLAESLGISKTSVSEILKGKEVKTWKLVDALRERENMIMLYEITPKGVTYAQTKASLLASLLNKLDSRKEASELSEAMLREGHKQFHRRRVQCDLIGAEKRGLVRLVEKKSGAIY